MLEPIQGEAGVIIPPKGYIKEVSKICKANNVLLILDEVQTGFGRTGKLMCSEWEGVKPDILAVGKALSGGMMPASAAFCNNDLMLTIKPGDHGSTFGGNPLAMCVAREAIKTIIEENMVENSLKMGEIFQDELSKIKSPLLVEMRGRGLFNCIELNRNQGVDANDLALHLMKFGLLTKATQQYMIRLAPALIIKEDEIRKAVRIIKKGMKALKA